MGKQGGTSVQHPGAGCSLFLDAEVVIFCSVKRRITAVCQAQDHSVEQGGGDGLIDGVDGRNGLVQIML